MTIISSVDSTTLSSTTNSSPTPSALNSGSWSAENDSVTTSSSGERHDKKRKVVAAVKQTNIKKIQKPADGGPPINIKTGQDQQHRPNPRPITQLVEFPIRPWIFVGAGGPFFGSVICLIFAWTSNYHLVLTERTYCENITDERFTVPSLSQSIGVYTPNRQIWLAFIIVHFLPRPMLCYLYTRLYESSGAPVSRHWLYRAWNRAMAVYYAGNMAGIVVLSVVDIEFHYPIHVLGFLIWIFCSGLFMINNTVLHHFSGWRYTNRKNQILFWVKLTVTALQIFTSLAIFPIYTIFYVGACEMLAHRVFSWVEYLVLFLDIVFLSMPFFELPHLRFGMYVDFTSVYTDDYGLDSAPPDAYDHITALDSEPEEDEEEDEEKQTFVGGGRILRREKPGGSPTISIEPQLRFIDHDDSGGQQHQTNIGFIHDVMNMEHRQRKM